jgi:hypothetical protein
MKVRYRALLNNTTLAKLALANPYQVRCRLRP